MKYYIEQSFTGERAMFMTSEATFHKCYFHDGESPLKESKDIQIIESTFQWKYPIWYCQNVKVRNSKFLFTARSGIWYTKNIEITDTVIEAPKTFRRSESISLINVKLPHADETLWKCKGVKLINVEIKGDYFGFNSEDLEIENISLDGNYGFDGAKNIKIHNSVLKTKDAFWNVENVVVTDSTIIGEYLAWNSRNVTFINCKIISHQGLCYMDNVKMINCELIDSDLCFEYCSRLDIKINNVVESIKNPISGRIECKGIKKLILEKDKVDVSKTEIVING